MMILDMSQIKANIASLKCGSQMGTAFLISKDKALTALHCIEEYREDVDVELTFKHLENEIFVKATPLNMVTSIENNLDVIVLELEKEVLGQEYFQLSEEVIPRKEKWQTYGYPQIESQDGIELEGEVIYEKNEKDPEDYDLVLQYDETLPGTEGLSGSPLIINGQVKGIIKYDRGKRNTLGAVSIKKAALIFEGLDIRVYSKEDEKEIEAIQNTVTKREILDYINQTNKGYIFIKGVPGSGKTTFVHNLKLESQNIEVLGKYYLKGIEDQYNIQYNSSREIFGKWVLDTVSEYLFRKPLKEEIRSDIELIKLIHNYLGELSEKGKKIDKKFVFFVDGIDEILLLGEKKIVSFFSILPRELKESIFIVVSGNNENLIPQSIKSSKLINMSPLEIDKVTIFIKDSLVLKETSSTLIRRIAEKSEGNPLYLKYLISYLNTQSSITDKLISTIPSFNGEIENYYKLYWKRIESNRQLINALAIIARIRKLISKEEFLKMLPLEEQYVLGNTLSTVSHLINESNNNLRIYHTSFENFIREKTLHLDKYIHGVVANFCVDNRQSRYSLENILYHLINSEGDLRKDAIKSCNQEWMDLCSFENVDLELMFIDIENVLDISIDEGSFSEIIRVLLLFQRFKFRNEKLFRTFSVEIAKALYEMGKGKEILNYITRNDSLIETISNEDIMYFLRKLTKDGFILESKKLVNMIKTKCIKEFENKDGTSFSTFLLDVSSSFLASPKEAMFKIRMYSDLFLENYPETGEELKITLVAEPLAWLMKEYDHYADTDTLKNLFGTKRNKNSINFISKIILFYIEMQDSCLLTGKNKGLLKAVEDLENLLQEYNVQENSESILALIQFSKNTALLERLIKNESEPSFNLRSANQVDFNFSDYLKYRDYWVCKGYAGNILEKKNIVFPGQWEEFILYMIKKVGNILGKCYRAKATKDADKFLDIYKEVLEMLENLKISFKERTEWKRSYFIPENTIPLIYKEVAFIYMNFFENKTEDLKKYLVENYQLGLYNEGYRRSLFYISEEMVKNEKKAREAFAIVKELDEFIDKYILNRWERNRDFLRIIKLYGQMKAVERAELTYKKMLETSMGPSWYKEAQLTLMATGIGNLDKLTNKEEYISKILGNLQYASGEVTFQRYVRDDKEQMVGIISRLLNTKKSIEYLKKMTYPTYEELLNNTKLETTDIIEESQGYIQGSNEINIQDAMNFFIKELKDTDPIIKYALTEIFIQGDERYFEDYVNLQIKILNSMEDKSSRDYKELIARIKRQFVVELDERRRSLFIEVLEKHKKITFLDDILLELESLDVPKDKIETMTFMDREYSSERIEDPIISLAKREIEFGNINQVKKMLANRLVEINEESGDIFNWSNESIECLKLLQAHCESEQEFIRYLKPICFKTYNLDWQIANEFISRARLWLSEEESKKTMEEILGHTELMLRVPKDDLEKYKWIEDANLNDGEYELEEYIIWLTNLPYGLVHKTKAIEVLIWLGKVRPQTIIPLLIQHSLENKKEESSETAASILHALSKTEVLEHIWYFIQLNNRIQTNILEEKHFIIKSCYYEIAKLAQSKNFLNAEEYMKNLEAVLFSSKETGSNSKLNLDNYSTYLNNELNFILKELNSNTNINEEFLQKLILNFEESISPLTIEEFKKVDGILERSYFIPEGLSNSYVKKFKNEINLLISDYVTIDNYNELKKELRSYNPYFPESKYCLDIPNIYPKIKDILGGKRSLNSDFLYYKEKLILHYNEIVADKELRKGNRIEMTAFLMENSKEIPDSKDELYDSFQANLEPQESKVDMEKFKEIYPLVHKCTFAFCNNSWYTPSDIHPNFKNEYSLEHEDIQRKTWKSGTILDVDGFGMPIGEGSLLVINKELIEKFGMDYRLVYRIDYNLGEQILFLDTSRKSIIRVV